MLLHKCNSICIIPGDSLCRADSQGTRWAVGGEGSQCIHLLGLPDFVLEPRQLQQGI